MISSSSSSATILTLSALLALTTALPTTNLQPRAGGPAIVPIPPQCTVPNPLPPAGTSSPPARYVPTAAFTAAHKVYSYYLEASSSSTAANWDTCIQQCNGLGSPGTCKSAYMAEQVPAPPLYGGPGGYPTTACIMFGEKLTQADVELFEGAGWEKAKAGVIECPP